LNTDCGVTAGTAATILMKNDTILVLADPAEPQLTMLANQLAGVKIIAGNSVEVFEQAAVHANVLFNWSGSLALFRKVFGMCPNLRWVHSRAVGLERTLFPEMIESLVPLTNGSGVFSASLGEFVLGAILYFAKGFRRMNRNQTAGIWEPFNVMSVSGQTVQSLDTGTSAARSPQECVRSG
jgi:phosphoglycerate dehydrogenase-like enzyme